MECNEAQELVVAHVRGELTEDQSAALERHLEICPSCRWKADAARRTIEILEHAVKPDIVQLATGIIHQAIDERASDIHIEPGREEVIVRTRVDGVLHETRQLPKTAARALVARIQTMADTDPFELRTPQMSRIQVSKGDREYDLRVSVLPTYWGPRVTMRIMDKSSADALDLEKIGISETNLQKLRELMRKPCGLIIFAGPAGSGLTTTMYSCLQEVKHPGVSVMTAESPVAFVMDGISQIQVDPRHDLDYPAALKAIMASDPDVVMVGQLGDEPTGTAALGLALTGHLLLAAVHGPNASSAITRLLGIGLDPHLLGPSLLAVISQRLVRKVCENCKGEYAPPADEISFLHQAGVDGVPEKLWKGAGCDHCHQTGYRGRTAIHEILELEADLVAAICSGAYTDEVGRRALAQTLAGDGAEKASQGVTTVAEVKRVTASTGW